MRCSSSAASARSHRTSRDCSIPRSSASSCGCVGCTMTANPSSRIARAYREAGREMGTDPPFRFVTASLQVDYLRPTPLGVPLELRGSVEELSGRKVIIRTTVSAEGELCARGRVVAVQMPEHLVPAGAG